MEPSPQFSSSHWTGCSSFSKSKDLGTRLFVAFWVMEGFSLAGVAFPIMYLCMDDITYITLINCDEPQHLLSSWLCSLHDLLAPWTWQLLSLSSIFEGIRGRSLWHVCQGPRKTGAPKSYPECAAMHKHPIAKFWTQATELMVKVMERSCLNLSAGIHMNMFSWLDPTQHNIFISHSV